MSHYKRKIAEILTPRRCQWHECRKQFMPTKPWQKFCSREHLNAHHNLIISNSRALRRIKEQMAA